MKQLISKCSLAIAAIALSATAFAGNKDRSGQAGATELNINPWGASAGLFGANTSNVRGIEAMKGNIAGLSLTDGTEIGAAYNIYLKGANVNVYNLSFAQSFGKDGSLGVFGLSLTGMGFGDITITDYNNPAGGVGTYSPSLFNIQFGYAKSFSHAIHAGFGVTFVSEQITDAGATGAAFEAGVQYTTGLRDNFHFGVTLRNVGTNMRFTGEGFSVNSEAPQNTGYSFNTQTPGEKFEMPTYLNIGAAYDIYLDGKHLEKVDDLPKHRLTPMAGFTSNSSKNDYIHVGLEYAYSEMFMLRGGYRYENSIADEALSATFFTGWSAGASVCTNNGHSDNGSRFIFDYAFRPTSRPDNGVHNFSVRYTLPGKKKAAKKAPAAAITPVAPELVVPITPATTTDPAAH